MDNDQIASDQGVNWKYFIIAVLAICGYFLCRYYADSLISGSRPDAKYSKTAQFEIMYDDLPVCSSNDDSCSVSVKYEAGGKEYTKRFRVKTLLGVNGGTLYYNPTNPSDAILIEQAFGDDALAQYQQNSIIGILLRFSPLLLMLAVYSFIMWLFGHRIKHIKDNINQRKAELVEKVTKPSSKKNDSQK